MAPTTSTITGATTPISNVSWALRPIITTSSAKIAIVSRNVITIAVGTNVPYAKYWELGHHNLFTRQFERVERWRPTLEATAPQMVERFQQLFRALVAG